MATSKKAADKKKAKKPPKKKLAKSPKKKADKQVLISPDPKELLRAKKRERIAQHLAADIMVDAALKMLREANKMYETCLPEKAKYNIPIIAYKADEIEAAVENIKRDMTGKNKGITLIRNMTEKQLL